MLSLPFHLAPCRVKLFIAAALVLMCSSPAWAIPTLQVYIPGATYDATTETWVYSGAEPFSLQIVGTYGTSSRLKNLSMDVAVPAAAWDGGGTIILTGPGYENGAAFSMFTYGIPVRHQRHGIYPTYYVSVPLPDMDLKTGKDATRDYSPSGWNNTGKGIIQNYAITTTGFEELHFDAAADALSKTGKWNAVFAPYSHDGEAEDTYHYASLGKRVWNDLNANGIQDAGEPGIPDVTVELLDSSGNPTGITAITNAQGEYLFEHLVPDQYQIAFTAPSGYHFSPTAAGSDPYLDSNADIVTGRTGPITLTSGTVDLSWDGGLYQNDTPPVAEPASLTLLGIALLALKKRRT